MIQYSYKHILRVQVITRFRLTYIAHSQTKSEYAYTTGTPGEPLSTVNYAYGNSDWKDLLTEYNGTAINYDLSGNPLNWRNASSLTWDGRRLSGMTLTDGTELAFEYNADGLRTSKTVGNSIVQYVWNDGNLVAEIRDGYTLKFLYNNGEAAGFSYNGADYYYGKDSFGVIRYLYNTSGEVVTTYAYDAWGNVMSVAGTLAETVGAVNPIRYKSYYLDSETGWYYLQSRYYDAAVGRFLNADLVEFLGVTETVISNNLFGYCENNAINYNDLLGYWKWPTIKRIPSFLISTLIDAPILLLASGLNLTWLGISAPLKVLSKKAALIVFQKAVIPAVKGVIGKIIQAAVNALIWIGQKVLAACINVAVTQALGLLLSNGARFLSACLSLGGFIAAIIDVCSDNKFDGWIRL